MADEVLIEKLDSVFIRLIAPQHVLRELSPFFTFDVPAAKFIKKKYGRGNWDGKIRLLNQMNGKIYHGLYGKLCMCINKLGYQINPTSYVPEKFDLDPELCQQFIKHLNLRDKKARDYQVQAFVTCVVNKRALILSPVASGKSLIIYMLAEWARFCGKKVVIMVPTTNLVEQMYADFVDYNPDCAPYISKVMAGLENDAADPIVITTWQSNLRKKKDWYKAFDTLIADEAHQYKAKALKDIMEATTTIDRKFGFTGTLDGSESNALVLEGLFGEMYQTATTAELIDRGILSACEITCIGLEYERKEAIALAKAKTEAKKNAKNTYQVELDYILEHPGRMAKIVKFVCGLKGNTLVLFRYNDRHGIPLYNMIRLHSQKRVHFVSGTVEGPDRERIRQIVIHSPENDVVASMGVFSTGTNIPNIDNIVFAAPSRSKIKVIQSIGRGLRTADGKSICNIFDFYDILPNGDRPNTTLEHFNERLAMYNTEGFKYNMITVKVSQ